MQLQERMTEIVGNSTLKQILYSPALRTLMLRHLRPDPHRPPLLQRRRSGTAAPGLRGAGQGAASALIEGAAVRALRPVEAQMEQDSGRGRAPARRRRTAS